MTDVAIAVVRHRGRFLVGRRTQDTFLAGFWEFPGGKVKLGETVREAAVRECLEETGLTVVIAGSCGDTHHRYTPLPERMEKNASLDLHLHFLACRLAGSTECPQTPFRWVTGGGINRVGISTPQPERDPTTDGRSGRGASVVEWVATVFPPDVFASDVGWTNCPRRLFRGRGQNVPQQILATARIWA